MNGSSDFSEPATQMIFFVHSCLKAEQPDDSSVLIVKLLLFQFTNFYVSHMIVLITPRYTPDLKGYFKT